MRGFSSACAALAAIAAGLLGGCAALDAPLRAHLDAESAQTRGCAEWFRSLDAEIDAAGVRDAQDARLGGFPYLRVNRLLAALAPRAAEDAGALQGLMQRMAELDRVARTYELANLPAARLRALPGLTAEARQAEALALTQRCARRLRALDFADPESRALATERARVADDYSAAQRLFGLYTLTRLPFAAGVRRAEAATLARFRSPPQEALAPGRFLVRYAPPAAPRLSASAAVRILAVAERDPLGIPQPLEQDLEMLIEAHAPSFEVEVADDADRFGRLRWRRDTEVPEVEGADPVVYVRTAHTLYRGRALLQLVYTIWFPERRAQAPGDILAGRLDGVAWRVTLAPDGEPVLFDSIHGCGCWHMFFPTPRARPLPPPDALQEWAFVPLELPRLQPGERPLLRIASGTHQIEAVSLVRGVDSIARYEFAQDDALRSLPRMEGGQRSVFGSDGLIPGTERPERHLYWPMGIASAGAMRQWGRHATAFVGRRHFDDADLLEKRFVLELP